APATTGTHTYWVAEGVNQNGTLCVGDKVSFTITINAGPTVQQNVNNVSICENNDYSFSVTVTGAVSYTWEYATEAAPTVWTTFTTHNGMTASGTTLNISH